MERVPFEYSVRASTVEKKGFWFSLVIPSIVQKSNQIVECLYTSFKRTETSKSSGSD